MIMLSRRNALLLTAAAALSPTLSRAAAYPERPITVIVPYAAGGAGDVTIRLLAPSLEKTLGQPLIIDARAGGGGTIGARAVASSAADGYTLMLGAANNFAINQFMFPKVKFDPLAEFALITKVADVPSVFYIPAALPVKTLAEFVAYAKSQPGKLSYASPSVGTTPHLAVERFKQAAGIELVHVPYRGAPPAMQALLANEVQLYLAGWGVGRAHVESGKVRAIAVAAEKRLPGVDVPTLIEAGYAGFVASNWWGLAAPKGTPAAICEQLHAAVVTALKDPAILARLTTLGFVAVGDTPTAFLKSAEAEAAIWKQTIERGKLAVD
ncbi:MAG TPA: tripartite tricarboxylate transporter substrate binding protein [Pseudolabrys sp.]|jgi:tripartite-type tricarboxylate transporter receptor subunit TctC